VADLDDTAEFGQSLLIDLFVGQQFRVIEKVPQEAAHDDLQRLAGSNLSCRGAMLCARPRDLMNDHPRHECALGAHEAQALSWACGIGCETTNNRTLYDLNHRGRNFLWNSAAQFPPIRLLKKYFPGSFRRESGLQVLESSFAGMIEITKLVHSSAACYGYPALNVTTEAGDCIMAM